MRQGVHRTVVVVQYASTVQLSCNLALEIDCFYIETPRPALVNIQSLCNLPDYARARVRVPPARDRRRARARDGPTRGTLRPVPWTRERVDASRDDYVVRLRI
eukprot:COSAG02_NODE_2796_length_8012_cov_18.557311_3_plen_103_part_00